MAYQQPFGQSDGVRQSTPRPLLPSRLAQRLRESVRRVIGIVLLACVAASWMALVSWSLHDPSLSHATAMAPRNWLGRVGSIGGDVLLQTFGLTALVTLLAPMQWGLSLAAREPVPRFARRAISYWLSVLTLSAAASAVPLPASWPLYHGLGGIIGDAGLLVVSTPLVLAMPDVGRLIAGIVLGGLGLWLTVVSTGATSRRSRATPHTNVRRPEPVLPELPLATLPVPEAARVPDPRTRVQYGPYAAYEPDAGKPIDPEFEAWTDEASSGIASRFAPASQAPETKTPRALQDAVMDAFTGGRRGVRTQTAPLPPAETGPVSAFQDSTPATVRTRTGAYKRPSLNLLEQAASATASASVAASLARGNARLLEDTLAEFGVSAAVRHITPGPVVTLYEIELARGTNPQRVAALGDDVARGLAAPSLRVVSLAGGAVGIEMPNPVREPVLLRDVLQAEAYRATMDKLPVALGKSITGEPVIADLSQLPGLLVSGANGSGKTTGINAMILSLLYKHGPDACRFLLIDEKRLDLCVYNGIPHLLTPVVSDPHKALTALSWCVTEMEQRVKKMASLGVRNIDLFNNRVRNAVKRGEQLTRTVQTGFDERTGQATYVKEAIDLEPLPYIVIVIDEFAGLMAVAGREIEGAVARLADAARCCGIHLIIATERPSADIVTGAVKSCMPARIAYKTATRADSRSILGADGAEHLLGAGDMLYTNGVHPQRVHGPYVSQSEIETVTDSLRRQGAPNYVPDMTGSHPDDRPGEPHTERPTLHATARTSAMAATSAGRAL